MARHLHNCSVRWSDMDAFGHVNNVTFLRYLEEARMDFSLTVGQRSLRAPGSNVAVVARHAIAYLRPLRYRAEPVAVEMWVSAVEPRSFTLVYEIKDSPGPGSATNTLYARAETVMVPYDLSRSRTRELSPGERSLYSHFLPDEAGADGRAFEQAAASSGSGPDVSVR